ncbi:MAG: 2OG-Fe(II) oxygenase family protein [Pseudomonadota bacterium]
MTEDQKSQPTMGGRIVRAFTTPIGQHMWPDSDALNQALYAEIMAKETKSEGSQRSNIGGWHSDRDLLLWGTDAVTRLRKRMQKMSKDLTKATLRGTTGTKVTFLIEAWANVSRHGHYNKAHIHPGSHWSGVYYVSVGEPEPGSDYNGALEFLDPRNAINMVTLPDGSFAEGQRLHPVPGLMVMFPSWLRHTVHPFYGTGERISIAFNVRIAAADEAKTED